VTRLRWWYHAAARRYWQTIVVNQGRVGFVDAEASARYLHHLSRERGCAQALGPA
jgi:hypothetical protein